MQVNEFFDAVENRKQSFLWRNGLADSESAKRKKKGTQTPQKARARAKKRNADRQPASQPVEIRDFAGGDPDPMIHIPWFPGAEMTSSNVFGYVCSRHLSPQPPFLPKHVTWKILWKSSFLCWGNEQVFDCLFVLVM
jgi:hypothetical protein